MIIVKNSGYLYYKNLKFKCALGKKGIKNKLKEGDKITPKGTYKISTIYYRADRIKFLKTKLKKIIINKNMAWCNDPNHQLYNNPVLLPFKGSYEKLYRKDHVYDLVAVINYNTKPIIKNKGSAIFLHLAKKNYSRTLGCIALKKNDLIRLLKAINKNTKIYLN
jgi:L,D-peptidoglycan transpeptidase YkuD (ErfK/YbiS/YcfS/YnhG family)